MSYVVIRVHIKRTLLGRGAAELLVNYALLLRRRRPWQGLTVESFPGRSETLVLARPAAASFRLADYALPFLFKYARRR